MNVSRELLKLGEAGSGVELAVRGLGIMGDNDVEVDEKSRGMSFILTSHANHDTGYRK